MPSCRSACVKRYSLLCVFCSVFCFLYIYLLWNASGERNPHLFSLSKLKIFASRLLVSRNCWYSLSLPHCLRESRCGPTPRSVSTKCEPLSSPSHSRPQTIVSHIVEWGHQLIFKLWFDVKTLPSRHAESKTSGNNSVSFPLSFARSLCLPLPRAHKRTLPEVAKCELIRFL